MSEALRDRLNRNMPLSMVDEKAGDIIAYAPVVFEIPVTADARAPVDGAPAELVVPFGCKIINVWIKATAADSNGTLRLSDGTDNITNAMVCAVDNTVVNAGTIDKTKNTLAAGSKLVVTANQTATRGVVHVMALRS